MRVKLLYFLSIASFALAILSACAPPALSANRYALVIGISDYVNAVNNDAYVNFDDLAYPAQDAIAVAELLESKGWVIDDHLVDHTATKVNIARGIEQFFGDIPPESTALIYFSGHGAFEEDSAGEDSPILLPSDFDDDAWSPTISPGDLSAWISSYIPTKKVIVIIDACYSGGFVAPYDSRDVIGSPYNPRGGTTNTVSALAALGAFGESLSLNAAATGTTEPLVIAAAGSQEESWETDTLGHGVFTYYLLESAEEGDYNSDGYVSCTEAYTYAARRIDDRWNDSYSSRYGFYPHISGGFRDFILF